MWNGCLHARKETDDVISLKGKHFLGHEWRISNKGHTKHDNALNWKPTAKIMIYSLGLKNCFQ